ncbi:MAG: ankyrin repeat domain-containing protein [Coriobacteriales bacterium]|jgi:hypothetical protein|nr:ankyrin repeat domain-containing protein [Coriobacteriales bacterium]
MSKKKRALPKNFKHLLETGDSAALRKLFERCELDATGGLGNGPALSFAEIPDDLARWLVEQGANVNARNQWDRTPLCEHAMLWDGKVRLLLELGADPSLQCGSEKMTALHYAAGYARTGHVAALLEHGADAGAESHSLSAHNRHTPLSYALTCAQNATLESVAQTAELLLAAGAAITPDMQASVQRIGEQFEFLCSTFNKELLAAADAGLARLYELFSVAPVARRVTHDDATPLTVSATDWMDQHRELWQLLVPPAGAAKTVQGEVIRITGRVSDEISRNGGMNWDKEYRSMLDALLRHLATENPLPDDLLAEAAEHKEALRRSVAGHYHEADRLCELSVAWVLANPQPTPLGETSYRR